MFERHCPIDRDERIYADNWQDEPTEEDIERQRSIIEAQADLEEMYNGRMSQQRKTSSGSAQSSKHRRI